MKNRFIIYLLLFTLPLFAQNNIVESEFIAELIKYNSNLRSIKCKCTQTIVVAIFDKPISNSGMFYYMADDNIFISMENGVYIKIINRVLEIKSGKNITKIKLSSDPAIRNLSQVISACFKGDFSALNSMYNILYEKGKENYKLKLSPKKESKNAMSVELIFDAKDMSLNSLKKIESKDNYTEYTFYDKEFNVDVNDYFSK